MLQCKKTGHLSMDYSSLQATSSRRSQKKKALKATWDDSESDSDEEIYSANVCFMAHRDDPTKVSLETTLDDDELSMNELATFFLKNYNIEISFQKNKTRNLKRKIIF